LDFMLLTGNNKDFFLFKHNRFDDFVFFLEIESADKKLITVRRSVRPNSKISFKLHAEKYCDYSKLPDAQWNHTDLAFNKAKLFLDGFLNLSILKPWGFRQGVSYFIRGQHDYIDVFQLSKHRGKDALWKPFLAHLLGFDDRLIQQRYNKLDQLEQEKKKAKLLEKQVSGPEIDLSKIDGLLLIKKQSVEHKQAYLDKLDFAQTDEQKVDELTKDIDTQIAKLNDEKYHIASTIERINKSLDKNKIRYNPDEEKKLFAEVGIIFPEQIQKDFNQLISFNKAITQERTVYLEEEKNNSELRLKKINAELEQLHKKQTRDMSFITEPDFKKKYKVLSNELIDLKADIKSLEASKEILENLYKSKHDIRQLKEECDRLQYQIEQNVHQQHEKDTLFSRIRLFFSECIKNILACDAVLTVKVNTNGNIEFKAEIIDGSGNETSAASGTTYKKLLCIAFDLALLKAYKETDFPHFVFHDGCFEGLDDRKKRNLLALQRKYAEDGVQSIITAIDSDIPADNKNNFFHKDEIVLTLHDKSDDGRLFKGEAW
ncbi:MAG: DUF2326 domain-containing protein, partial [Endozoicomonadaceae bacterium]|nr:DUF2326 domain-containing protein [Endozoicomonadaceae bacterium]